MRIAKLDHLRALAAILVVVDHFTSGIKRNGDTSHDALVSFLRSGHLGVSLFLVLSGVVLTQSALANRTKFTYRNFIKRRIFRIFPALVVLFVLVITATRASSTPMDIVRLFTLQFNTGNKYSGWGNDTLPVGVMWTASVELQIYLLFPFLLWTALKKQAAGLRFLLEVCAYVLLIRFVFLTFIHDGWSDLYHTLFGRLDQFVLGMLLAIYFDGKQSKSSGRSWMYLGIAVISFLALGQFRGIYRDYYTSVLGGSFSFLVEGLVFVAIIFTYQSTAIRIPAVVNHGLAWVGERSYSIYLFHLLIGRSLVHYLESEELWVPTDVSRTLTITLLVIVPIVILFSALSYRVIEKPFIELGKQERLGLPIS